MFEQLARAPPAAHEQPLGTNARRRQSGASAGTNRRDRAYCFMAKVFVFGTLKKGFPLHDVALCGARFLGTYRTIHPIPLVIAGPWFAPMMLDQPGIGMRVEGELYEIDDAELTQLDDLESLGEIGNFRKSIHVEAVHERLMVEAAAYMKANELADPIHSGYLADYQDHRFVPPWER
jgi:gamma-glutamylaminecyclotransferase